MYFALFLLAVNLVKLALIPHFPLIGDEAYYWLWGRHLDLSYIDHPPMIAYVNFFLTALFGSSEAAVRLAAISIVLLISWIIYLTGKELKDERAGILAAVVFNLLPTFFGGGLFLVPQTLLFLFWSLSFYLFVKITATRGWLWYVLGISAGLGLLSDYIMAFFFAGAVLCLLINRGQRFWLARKEPYLGAIIALLIFSPVVIWNFQHHFPSFGYHETRFAAFDLSKLLYFAVLQMALYTPTIFFLTIRETVKNAFSAAVFLPFALMSPFIHIGGHWTAAAYLPALFSAAGQKRTFIVSTLLFAGAVNFLVIGYYLFYYPAPKDMIHNRELAGYIANSQATAVSNNLGLAGLVAFHGRTKVYLPPGRHPQYDLWGKLELKRGDKIIYFALNETELYGKLKPLFKKVTIDPQKRIFTKDADIPNQTQIFICEGYRGGIIP